MILKNIDSELIYSFLKKVNRTFPVTISEKQDLFEYAKKLSAKATICVEIRDDDIVSMVAGYTTGVTNNQGYIALVATVPEVRGQGLAGNLVREFLSIAKEKKLSTVHLYTVSRNEIAVKMYREIGFDEYIIEAETRKQDLHLIYYLDGGK